MTNSTVEVSHQNSVIIPYLSGEIHDLQSTYVDVLYVSLAAQYKAHTCNDCNVYLCFPALTLQKVDMAVHSMHLNVASWQHMHQTTRQHHSPSQPCQGVEIQCVTLSHA